MNHLEKKSPRISLGLLALLLALLLTAALSGAALAAESVSIAIEDCTEIGTYDGDPIYYYAGPLDSDCTQIVFSDFANSMGDYSMIAAMKGNAYVEETHIAPANGGYKLPAGAFDDDDDLELDQELDLNDLLAYWIMDEEFDTYYFFIRLQAEEQIETSFTPSAGSVTASEEDGYTYYNYVYEDGAYVPIPAACDLYTLTVPFGTQELLPLCHLQGFGYHLYIFLQNTNYQETRVFGCH